MSGMILLLFSLKRKKKKRRFDSGVYGIASCHVMIAFYSYSFDFVHNSNIVKALKTFFSSYVGIFVVIAMLRALCRVGLVRIPRGR